MKYGRIVLFWLVSLPVFGLCAQSARAHLYVATAVENWDIEWVNNDGVWPGFYGQTTTYSATIWGWDYTYGWVVPVPITMDGESTGYSTPHTFTGLSGTHKFTVPSTNSAGHPFSEWSSGWTDETIKVTETGTYTARYRAGYCATIRSWCTVDGWTYGLPIIMDGKSTGYTTLHTFSGLIGTHTFTVPSTDALGHRFDVWSTGWVNEWNNVGTGTTLTVSSAGMYTARYKLATASLTVKSPNGGENWVRGTTHAITWTSSGSVGSYVKIEILKSGVVKGAVTTANDGSYSWTIGSSHLGTDYKIRITSTSNPAITDSSDNYFTITAAGTGTLTVTSPNGGESWKRGTTHPITWTSTGAVGSTVKIELLKSGVVKGALTTANDGSYLWTIGTSNLGGDYKIRITSTSNPAITDSSDNYFAITT